MPTTWRTKFLTLSKFIYTVRQLNGELRTLLETSYASIWVEGEISGLSKPASGHLYFSLKDENAVIRCAFFRNRQNSSTPAPKEGMQVLLHGHISYYQPRGNLQFIVSYMEEAGEGALRRAFEALKQKLASEGLFDQQHKQALPAYPKSIGLITSDSGAALHDILVTLRCRYPLAGVIIYPALVQGTEAPKKIVAALEQVEKRQETDVVIVARGGGSLEDLQAFNHESVIRKIFECTIPVVSGVGHEVDFTICDFVSDHRALTPTAAAEMVTPDIRYIRQSLWSLQAGMTQSALKRCQNFQQGLDISTSRLVHPRQKLAIYRSEHRHLSKQLVNTFQMVISQLKNKLKYNSNRVAANSPGLKVQYLAQKIRSHQYALKNHAAIQIGNLAHALSQYQGKIQLLSPRHTLNRGYAIVQDGQDKVITDPVQLRPGQALRVKVSKGRFGAVVNEI